MKVYAIKEEVYVAFWVWFSQRARRMILLGYKEPVFQTLSLWSEPSEGSGTPLLDSSTGRARFRPKLISASRMTIMSKLLSPDMYHLPDRMLEFVAYLLDP